MSQATVTKPTVITDAPIHPSLASADLAKARAWYSDKLGWEPTLEPPGVLVYELGGADSAFTIFETPFAGTAKNTVMNWVVPDVRAEVGRLRARGVTFEEYETPKTVDGIAQMPAGRAAWFRDPEGNLIGMIEMTEA